MDTFACYFAVPQFQQYTCNSPFQDLSTSKKIRKVIFNNNVSQ